jgi:hypothetical protein
MPGVYAKFNEFGSSFGFYLGLCFIILFLFLGIGTFEEKNLLLDEVIGLKATGVKSLF